MLRGNLTAGLENVALWHERDMSHSSVERIVLTDSLILTYYMAKRFRAIAAGLVVHEDRMLENLAMSHGLVFSESVMLALVESGPAARRRLPHGAARRHPHLGGASSVP